ncbi:hypothetical protein KUTeg_002213 [Tegillarca granosa]|uniref:Uncharacterized protein n=1 Tax=Tegillarca granosa TaxID=220873 RepID=A0ABQ9FV60_TEGGR|nr:hypothetical protein KUTeg_002213 [Tegillarca granosa]
MLTFSDFSLIFFFISIFVYMFVSFKVALTILVVSISTLYGAQVVFDFKFKPVKTATRQSKFSQKTKVKQKKLEDSQNYQRKPIGQFLNFLNFDDEKSMNSSFSLGRKTSFRTKSPKRNAVGRSHSFSVPSSSNVTQKHKINQSFMASAGPLLTLPFLPRVKRALGLDSESSPRKTVTQPISTNTTHPPAPSPGFLPAVRLGRREKFNLSANSSVIRSPNTVKIAPPEPHRLSSPRLLEVRNNSHNSEQRRTPDTQAVVSALKEKSIYSKKRTMTINEDAYTEYPIHQAKRRRQESQQSNASTSSLPPLPANLPDLSTSGYTIPRLETPTLKRTADLSEHEWEENIASAKRLRKENRNNSIISSLSSMKRVELKEGEGFGRQNKRKVRHEEKENFTEVKKVAKSDKASIENNTSICLDRSDTLILPPDFDQSIGQHSQSINESTGNISDTSSILDKSQADPKLQKRVSLNETFSARKRQMSFYSGLNKSFKKVPQANVLASMEDYEFDREAEQQRVQEMLEGIEEAEKEKQDKNEKSKVQPVSALTSTLNSAGSSQSVASVAPTSTTTLSSIVAPVSLSTTASSLSSASTTSTPATTAEAKYTFKPAFGDVSAPVTLTTTPAASSLNQVTGVATTSTTAPSASSSNESSGLKFNFGTVKSYTTTISPTTATNIGLSSFPSTGLTSNTSTTTSTSTMPSITGFGTNGINFGNTTASVSAGTGVLQSTLNSTTTASSSAGAPVVNNNLLSSGACMFGMASAGGTTTTNSSGSTITSLGQNTNPSFGTGVLGSNVTPFAANNTTPGLNFGTSATPTNVVSGFSFASTTTTNSGSALGTAPTSVTSGFGTSLFGQKPPPPAYGEQVSSASSQPFAALQSASGSAAFNFGGASSTNTPASQSVFRVTSSDYCSSVNWYIWVKQSSYMLHHLLVYLVQKGQTTSAPSIFGTQGQATAAPSVFGSFRSGKYSAIYIWSTKSRLSAAPSVFGSTGQTTTASSIFGSTVQSTTSNSNSFNFGGSTGQNSTFQNATNTQTNQTSSVFGGQSTNQTSNFNFGTTPVTKSSVFGNAQQSSSFGGTSAFGQEKSNTFSTNPSTTQSGFSFGSSTASFGGAQTTQQTGFAASNSNNQSGNTVGNTFTFGASTPVKTGFDFSSSASGGGSTNGFNFNASFGSSGGTNQAPGFGTPTAGSNQTTGFGTPTAGGLPTPNFGTPTNNMFSIGTSNTSARPRATAKPKRRGTSSRR